MVAVARDGVQVPQFLFMRDDDALHLGEHGGGQPAQLSCCRRRVLRFAGHGVFRSGQLTAGPRSQVALAEGGGIGRSCPELLQFVVQPQQRQGEPGHVQAGDQLAAFRFHHRQAGGGEELFDLPEKQEQLVVLDRAQAVDDGHHTVPGVVGLVLQEPGDQQFGEFGGGGHGVFGDARLAVDAEAQRHLPGGHVEQRRVRSRQRAAVECHAQGTGAVVGPDGQTFDGVEVQSCFRRGTGNLEDRQVPGNAAALLDLVQRSAGDVVRDQDGAGFDALGVKPQLGLAEVEHVAGVVAVAQQHAAARVGGLGHPVDLAGCRGSEHVATGGARGEARSHEACEGRVVAGSAAHHQGHLAGGHLGGADHAAVHPGDVPAVGCHKAVQCLIREISGVVEDLGHGFLIESVLEK
ncbi:hypothetical protein D9M72_421580 [compost metagenome]